MSPSQSNGRAKRRPRPVPPRKCEGRDRLFAEWYADESSETYHRPEELWQRLHSQPFEPFRICLSDGTAYEIPHPELVMVGRRSAVVGITEARQAPPSLALPCAERLDGSRRRPS